MPITQSATLASLATALSAAQARVASAAKDATNPHFKSKYADLASVWAACRQALVDNGLSVYQGCEASGAAVTVTTMLLHKSGEFIQSALTMQAQQNTPQGIGSTITYARRYALSAAVGVAPDDDDGHAGSWSAPQEAPVRTIAKAPLEKKKQLDPAPPDPVLTETEVAALRERYSLVAASMKAALGEAGATLALSRARILARDKGFTDLDLVKHLEHELAKAHEGKPSV